ALPDPGSPGLWKSFVLDFRGGPAVRAFVDGAELARYATAGVATPDHTIRTKNYPLIVPSPEAGDLAGFAAKARQAVERFVAEYHAYFGRHNARQESPKRELDPMPRVILAPGQGRVGCRRSRRVLDRDRDLRRGGRRLRVAERSRFVRDGILVAGTGK